MYSRNNLFMKITLSTILLSSLLLIGISACSPAPTPAPILADAAFSCQAFLDANGNGEIDDADTPVAGASFYVEYQGVKGFMDTTDETGNAYILIPGGLEYPVTVGIDAPKDSGLHVVGSAPAIITPETGSTAQFLFTSK